MESSCSLTWCRGWGKRATTRCSSEAAALSLQGLSNHSILRLGKWCQWYFPEYAVCFPWSVSVEICLNGKSLCKSGILCTLLAIQPNSGVLVWVFFFLFISSMLLIPVTIENMQFAVWTQLPCCIFQSESVLNGVVSLWVKKCQFQIWVLDFFFPLACIFPNTCCKRSTILANLFDWEYLT